MTAASPFGPAQLIKGVLKCTDEEAQSVVNVLAGPMQHRHTRAFLAIALHLSNTTRTTKATRDDVLINEGKRQFGLFLSSCAQAGLDLDLYSNPNGASE